jgi:predicted dehydrogenase
MRNLQIAVVGAGLIGRRHIEVLGRSKQCSLCAVVDPSEGVGRYASELGVPHFKSLHELFQQRKPDGVILATPNQLHGRQALECVAARVPAIIEKPVTDTLQQGIELLRATEAENAKLLVGHHRRYSSIMEKAIEVVESGTLGEIVAISGTTLLYKDESEGYYDGPFSWRREPGGGPILINLIHDIGNLRALAGEIIEVHAMASNNTRGFAVEDTAAINLRFSSGALGTFLLSDTAASVHSWEHTSGEDRQNFSAAQSDDSDCYLLCGTLGSLGIPTMRLRRYADRTLRSWRKPMSKSTIPLEIFDPLERQISHFSDVIRGKAEPAVSVRDGLANLRVVDAISQSARTGKLVRL